MLKNLRIEARCFSEVLVTMLENTLCQQPKITTQNNNIGILTAVRTSYLTLELIHLSTVVVKNVTAHKMATFSVK
jgi:hypothetical protein